MFVNGAESVTESELTQLFLSRHPALKRAACESLANQVKEGMRVNMDEREPVILCLDKVRAECVS